jgi:putative Mg2+ transporter-C (MgtC) family protein
MDTMARIVHAVGEEFSDLSAERAVILAIRLGVAGALGLLLGRERSHMHKSAGRRTFVLVALGSAAFVAVPQQTGFGPDAVSRVAQGLLAGIGFLGAGCIVKSEAGGHVSGLTTAAGIWLTAAVGAAAGLGREMSAVLIGLLGWFTLSVLGRGEKREQARKDEPGPKPDR